MMDGMFEMALIAQAQGQPSLVGMLAPMAIILIIFYFLLWRPQAKRQESHRKFVDALKKGDEVVTEGGMVGRVAKVEDKTVTIELGKGTKIKFLKQSIRGTQAAILSDDDESTDDEKDEDE